MKWTRIDSEHYESTFYRVTYNKLLPDDHRWVLEYKNSTLKWEHIQNFYNPARAKDFAERREAQKKDERIKERNKKIRQKKRAIKAEQKSIIIDAHKQDVKHINDTMREIKKQLIELNTLADEIGLTKEAKILSEVNKKLEKFHFIRKGWI